MRADKVQKRGRKRTMRVHKASVAQPNKSGTQVGTSINSVRRVRSDSNTACIVRSNWTWGLGHDVNSGASITPNYSSTNFSLLLIFSFPSLTIICANLRSRHTCFLQNHILLFTLREHYFINPLWISRSNTQIFPRRIFCIKSRTAV